MIKQTALLSAQLNANASWDASAFFRENCSNNFLKTLAKYKSARKTLAVKIVFDDVFERNCGFANLKLAFYIKIHKSYFDFFRSQNADAFHAAHVN